MYSYTLLLKNTWYNILETLKYNVRRNIINIMLELLLNSIVDNIEWNNLSI